MNKTERILNDHVRRLGIEETIMFCEQILSHTGNIVGPLPRRQLKIRETFDTFRDKLIYQGMINELSQNNDQY